MAGLSDTTIDHSDTRQDFLQDVLEDYLDVPGDASRRRDCSFLLHPPRSL